MFSNIYPVNAPISKISVTILSISFTVISLFPNNKMFSRLCSSGLLYKFLLLKSPTHSKDTSKNENNPRQNELNFFSNSTGNFPFPFKISTFFRKITLFFFLTFNFLCSNFSLSLFKTIGLKESLSRKKNGIYHLEPSCNCFPFLSPFCM